MKWVLQTTSTSSRKMLRFWYLPIDISHGKCATVHNISSSSTATTNHLCSFPGSLYTVVAYMRHPYSLIHVLFSDDPRRWKRTWDCCCGCHCHLSLPSMSWPYRESALGLYINGDRQPWPFTFGASLSVWRNNRNEFPESDASLEITGLKCCILTQRIRKDA